MMVLPIREVDCRFLGLAAEDGAHLIDVDDATAASCLNCLRPEDCCWRSAGLWLHKVRELGDVKLQIHNS